MSVQPQKWTLNQPALDTFLARLDPDRDCAAQQYERVRNKLVTFFRCNDCWDAEALVDETIDRVVRRLGEVEIYDLMGFIRGVARRVASEAHRIRRPVVSLDDAPERLQSRAADSGDRAHADRRYTCLERCLGRLSREERDLTLGFYQHDKTETVENRKRMAEGMGITTATLRVRAFRVRKQLERCITKCMGTSIPGKVLPKTPIDN